MDTNPGCLARPRFSPAGRTLHAVRGGRLVLLAPIASALATSGCATAIRGTMQSVAVVTAPPGAHCALRNRSAEAPAIVAVTPGVAEVRRGGWPLELRCTKAGHIDIADSYQPAFGGEGDQSGMTRAIVFSESLLRQFSLDAQAGPMEDAEATNRMMAGAGVVAGGAILATSAIVVSTAAPTIGGGVAIAGAGVVAAPILLGLVVALPLSFFAAVVSGAGYSYPAAVLQILPAATFADARSRDAYFAQADRSFDIAREALRQYTSANCRFGMCNALSEEDDAFVAERRVRFAEALARTQIATLADPESPPSMER